MANEILFLKRWANEKEEIDCRGAAKQKIDRAYRLLAVSSATVLKAA